MSVPIKQNFVSSSKYSIKCPNKMSPEYITVHNTANDASAENEIKYMINNNNQVSYHFAVDDKEIIQGLPLDRNAWHCGDEKGNGNMKSIGVEICYSKSGGTKYKAAEENAVKLIAQLLKERSWGIDRVKQHHDWSGKDCPHRIRAEGTWTSFLSRIETAMKKESVRMFKPSTNTLKNEMLSFLERAQQDGILSSKDWTTKLRKGELSLDDALCLMATIHNRSK